MSSSLFAHRLYRAMFLLAALVLPVFQLRADNGSLKADLQQALIGKEIISKVMFGCKATPRGYSAEYPVHTLVFSNGSVTYHVEFGLLRQEVSESEVRRGIESGTNLRVSGLDFKDDRLEIKVERLGNSNDSAKVKLMLGKNWQSTMNANAVLQFMSSAFSVDTSGLSKASVTKGRTQQKPTSPAADSSPAGPVDDAPPLLAYQRPPNAPEIPGRISSEEFQSILRQAAQEKSTATSKLLSQAMTVSHDLLSLKNAAESYPNFASHPLIRSISSLQHQLGRSLQPRDASDVVSLNETLDRCLRIFGQLAPRGSFEDSASLRTALGSYQERQNQIELTARAMVQIESTLDQGALVQANAGFHQLQADAFASQFLPSQRYLQVTANMRSDLTAYSEATQLPRIHDGLSVVDQVRTVANEASKLQACGNEPLAGSFLSKNLTADKEILKAHLDSLPAFEFDAKVYRLQPITNLTTQRSMETRLAALKAKLDASNELINLLASKDSMDSMAVLFGATFVATISSKGTEVQSAQQLEGNLSEALQRYQAKLDAEESRRQARLEEQNSLAERICNNALMIVMLEEKFQTTSVLGYEMEADKQRQELRNLLRRDHSLLTPTVWRAVQLQFNRILPGLTVWQASHTQSLIYRLKASSN